MFNPDEFCLDSCEKCEYHINGQCYGKKMEELADKIKEVFPNIDCFVEDGILQITFDIHDNINEIGPFRNAAVLDLNPRNGGIAEMYANIYPVEDAPIGPVYSRVDGGPIREEFPKQKYMIIPERVLW